MAIPRSHPRYLSLMTRERIVAGVAAGITSEHGLIAQGRGEAFDYLIGEKTHPFARAAIEAAAALLLQARHPVLSVNGNVAALAASEIVLISQLVGAAIEVNIFHTSKTREKAIRAALEKAGAERILIPSSRCVLPGLEHNRRYMHPQGIAAADVVFVPLEDGDRCQALEKSGRRVITVDLNPLSRTARTASITIVDNLVRALPLLAQALATLQPQGPTQWKKITKAYRQKNVLSSAEKCVRAQK